MKECLCQFLTLHPQFPQMASNPDIVTVTLNPAIDETVFIDQLQPGAVNRAHRNHRQAGGKGVNISSMLAQYGIATTATGFLGNQNPQLFEKLFRETGVCDAFIRIDGETRTGIKIISESIRETTDINLPGAAPTVVDLLALEEILAGLAAPNRWFVLAGSLPTGVSLTYFEGLLRQLKLRGALVAVDTFGEALKSAIACGVDLIKPNNHELAEILDLDAADLPSLAIAARELQSEKVSHVIVSLGRNGAFFVGPQGFRQVQPPPVQVVSTVGAGDSTLAGYLAGQITGRTAADCATLATVFAWSALEDVSRRLPSAAEIDIRMKHIQPR